MNKALRTLFIWLAGFIICLPITLWMVLVAYQQRGYWAIGGEYALIPLTIVICTLVMTESKDKL